MTSIFEKTTTRVELKKNDKKLSIFSPKFERHPSATKLLNTNEAKDFPINQIPDSILTPGSAPSPCPFTIILNETDNPLYDKNDTFYIKNNDITESASKAKTQKKSSEFIKPKFLSLTPAQIKLDNEITESIKKGKQFKEIKKMMKGLLIEKY